MKKEKYSYFNEFIKNSCYIVESSNILKSTINEYNVENLERNMNKVHELENKADENLHNMRSFLLKDFLPPIDREDIILIAHRLDDIEDEIDEILINFNILNISNIKKEAIEFSDLLVESTNRVQEALKVFENIKKKEIIREKIIDINKLEEQGDKLYEKAIKSLYTNCNDTLEVVKWSTIFRCFEDAIDACEHLADSIIDVVMKNS